VSRATGPKALEYNNIITHLLPQILFPLLRPFGACKFLLPDSASSGILLPVYIKSSFNNGFSSEGFNVLFMLTFFDFTGIAFAYSAPYSPSTTMSVSLEKEREGIMSLDTPISVQTVGWNISAVTPPGASDIDIKSNKKWTQIPLGDIRSSQPDPVVQRVDYILPPPYDYHAPVKKNKWYNDKTWRWFIGCWSIAIVLLIFLIWYFKNQNQRREIEELISSPKVGSISGMRTVTTTVNQPIDTIATITHTTRPTAVIISTLDDTSTAPTSAKPLNPGANVTGGVATTPTRVSIPSQVGHGSPNIMADASNPPQGIRGGNLNRKSKDFYLT